jgi:hypothetical protein
LRCTPEVVSFPGLVHNRTMSEAMQDRLSISACAVAMLAAMCACAVPANAATCADRTVQARGEPSRFEALAKAQARGNWRAQVRAMPALGPLYANWSIALDADYRCSEDKTGYTCAAVARPCRK